MVPRNIHIGNHVWTFPYDPIGCRAISRLCCRTLVAFDAASVSNRASAPRKSFAGKAGDLMGMLLAIHFESGFLNVDAMGKFSLKDAKRNFVEVLEAVARHKTKKVFFDGRKLVGKPGTVERFYYGEFAAHTIRDFAQRGVSPSTQFAFVLKEPVLDPGRFGETVAVNRGMLVRAFDRPEDALRWLGISQAIKSDAGDGK